MLVTCPDRPIANKLADSLVRQRLAACVNVIPGIRSVFRWQGKLDRCSEVLLLIKTQRRIFDKLRRAIRKQHPYDTPEIIAVALAAGDSQYLKWVSEAVSK